MPRLGATRSPSPAAPHSVLQWPLEALLVGIKDPIMVSVYLQVGTYAACHVTSWSSLCKCAHPPPPPAGPATTAAVYGGHANPFEDDGCRERAPAAGEGASQRQRQPTQPLLHGCSGAFKLHTPNNNVPQLRGERMDTRDWCRQHPRAVDAENVAEQLVHFINALDIYDPPGTSKADPFY